MTKRLDEDSIHPSETAYDKAIKRMEERKARILNSPTMQVAANAAEQIRVQQAPLIQALQPLQDAMQPYHNLIEQNSLGLMIATVITTTLEGIWVPWFINKLKMNSRDEINVIAKDYINLMTYAMAALILVAPEVVKILANESYWEGISIIPPVVLANYVIFAYSLYVNIEHYYKKTPYITVNTIIAAASNIVLNFIFIPRYGYIAAAYTTLASYFISFVLHTRYAKKLEPNLYPLKRFIYPLIELLVVTILFYMFEETFVIRWVIMIIYILAMFYKERNRLKVYFPNMPFWK